MRIFGKLAHEKIAALEAKLLDFIYLATKKMYPELAANCFRFSCDEFLIYTSSSDNNNNNNNNNNYNSNWMETVAKLTEVIETKLPLLKDVVRIGAFKLIRL